MECINIQTVREGSQDSHDSSGLSEGNHHPPSPTFYCISSKYVCKTENAVSVRDAAEMGQKYGQVPSITSICWVLDSLSLGPI